VNCGPSANQIDYRDAATADGDLLAGFDGLDQLGELVFRIGHADLHGYDDSYFRWLRQKVVFTLGDGTYCGQQKGFHHRDQGTRCNQGAAVAGGTKFRFKM